jgi:hypothetical protein
MQKPQSGKTASATSLAKDCCTLQAFHPTHGRSSSRGQFWPNSATTEARRKVAYDEAARLPLDDEDHSPFVTNDRKEKSS